MRSLLSTVATGAAFSLALAFTNQAAAADGDPCTALTGETNTVPTLYVENGDTQEAMLKKLGKALMQSTTPLRLVYRNRPTCNIRTDLFSNATMTAVTDGATPRPVRYIPGDAAFDPKSAAPTCTVPALGAPAALPITVGIGATYLSSCNQTPAQPSTVGVFEGPNQAYGFVTNKNAPSHQVAITFEEAYLAFGFTEGAGQASPWIVQNLRFKRANTASTTLTMASAMHMTATDVQATILNPDTSAQIFSLVGAETGNPDAVIGLLGMDVYDAGRDGNVVSLAFKTQYQKYAYYPDSTNATFDKANVRDGHYVPWAPTPYISAIATPTDTTFSDANARRLYELVMGTRIGDDVDGLKPVVTSGLIPKCAMKVTRPADGADLSLYTDPTPCGCYFDKNVPQGSTTCIACTDGNNTPCGAGVCRHSFCEAR